MTRDDEHVTPTHGILDALVAQKDALVSEIDALKTYDKDKSSQLDALARSIERVLAMVQSVQSREDDMMLASRQQMDNLLTAMNERIDELAQQRFNAMVERAASSLCPDCNAIIRCDDAQTGAITTG